MELLKLATEWAKAEVFSTRFFIFFAIGFLIASIGFWQFGKTDLAKAYIIPTLIVGILLLIIGSGLNYTNIQRVKQFEMDFNTCPRLATNSNAKFFVGTAAVFCCADKSTKLNSRINIPVFQRMN